MNLEPTFLDKLISWLESTQARRLILALCVVIAAGAYFLVVRPIQADTTKYDEQATTVASKTATTTAELEALHRQLDRGGSDISKQLARALPTDLPADQQLELLSRLSNATGAPLPNFEPATPTVVGDYQRLPLNLTSQCSLEACLRLLGGLNGMVSLKGDKLTAVGPIWWVDQLTLSAGAEGKMSLGLTSGMYLGAPATAATQAPTTTTP